MVPEDNGMVESAGGAGGLAGAQAILTSKGAQSVAELVRSGSFTALCSDPANQRLALRSARIRHGGRKRLIRIHTDKGPLELAAGHRLKLLGPGTVAAEELDPGTTLWSYSLRPRNDDLILSAARGVATLTPEHLVRAECAVANWYPRPALEELGPGEVYQVTLEGGDNTTYLIAWLPGPGGGNGLAIAC